MASSPRSFSPHFASCILLAALSASCAAGDPPARVDAGPSSFDAAAADGAASETDAGSPPARDAGPPPSDAGPPAVEDGGGTPAAEVPHCAACELDEDCGEGGVCASVEGGLAVCAARCTPGDDTCPAGLVCTPSELNPAVARCIPAAGDPCCVDEDGDGVGVGIDCESVDCDDADETVFPGAEELCDGVDQDCSGLADDGEAFECAAGDPEVSCTTACGTEGTASCNEACVIAECAADEACNGCDDDADGSTDEAFECAAGSSTECTTACGTTGTATCTDACLAGTCEPPAETCDGLDQDCDLDVDEDFECVSGSSEPCTTSCGTEGAASCDETCSLGACEPPVEMCNGRDDDCDLTVDEELPCAPGDRQECMTSCGSAGTQVCNDVCAFEACVPPDEVCNGEDDDCDGDVDEGFDCVAGSTGSCTTGCGTTGAQACSASCTLEACVPPAEVCNGADDDCDLDVDEDFECAPDAVRGCTASCGSFGQQTCGATCTFGACAPPDEVCGGGDDDCDGDTDEGFACSPSQTQPCATSCGSTGTQTCSASCAFEACQPPAETCDGVDEDCDDAVDETFGCALGETRPCTTSCGTTGTETCGEPFCNFGSCVPPEEICDGMDQDCDGVVDEGFECALGTAADCTTDCGTTGQRACEAGTCTLSATCTPPAEVCDGMDQDCDGQADDDFECTLDATRSCTTSCGSTGTETCEGPSCGFGSCDPPAESCNGLDDDCDGTPDNGFTCVAETTTRQCTVSGCTGLQTCTASCDYVGASCDLGGAPAEDACDPSDTPITASTTMPYATCAATDDYTGSCGSTDGHDVVYRVELAVRSELRVRTSGSTFDPVVYVRGPADCSDGSIGAEIGCDEDSAGGVEAEVAAQLDPGHYWVVVDGAAGEQGRGQLEIEINEIPANDTCAGAEAVALSFNDDDVGFIDGSTRGAANDHEGSACGCDGGPDVWYSYLSRIGTTTGRRLLYVYVDTEQDLSVHVLQGATCDGATPMMGACNDDGGCSVGPDEPRVAFALASGEQSYIVVDGCEPGDFRMFVQEVLAPEDIPNGTARLLQNGANSGSTITLADSTFGACATGFGPDDHWFGMVCPGEAAATVTADTCTDTSFDTELDMHTDRYYESATEVACDDDACDLQSSISATFDTTVTTAQLGELIWINVDGSTALNAGAYTLTVSGL